MSGVEDTRLVHGNEADSTPVFVKTFMLKVDATEILICVGDANYALIRAL